MTDQSAPVERAGADAPPENLCACGETFLELDAEIARLREADTERADYCNSLWYAAEDYRRMAADLMEALREQRRQMSFPGLDPAFALTMTRMIDRALEHAARGSAAPERRLDATPPQEPV